jgi:DNA-binding response OmpR family regulator
MTKRILIADDQPSIRELLQLMLEEQGFEVLAAEDGIECIRLAQEYVPDMAIVDLMMPGVDGYEVIRQLRNDTRTAHIPTLILTARMTPTDVVLGFETGADDYVTKPFNVPELVARIKSHLRRAAQPSVNNPLTGLPGNILLTEELKRRVRRDEPFALCHADLNNFKAFNDTYGYARGDRMIKLVATVLSETLATHGGPSDFLGHIGGDDFAFLTTPDRVETLCIESLKLFDQRARALYDPADLERGFLQGVDRQGFGRRFPVISLAIGVATNRNRQYADHEEVSRVAAEMKRFAKRQPGSTYAIDIRSPDGQPVDAERRGRRVPTVLLLVPDANLAGFLGNALSAQGYRVLTAPDVPQANAYLSHEPAVALILADARLGDALWEFAETCRNDTPATPLVITSPRAEDEDVAFAHGARAYIQQPFQFQQLLACVSQLARLEE